MNDVDLLLQKLAFIETTSLEISSSIVSVISWRSSPPSGGRLRQVG
jgi:hypothetical protein